MKALITHLPPESAYRTVLRNRLSAEELAALAGTVTEHGPWSQAESILAALYDAVNVLIHVQVALGGVKNQDPPQQLPRPGVTQASKQVNPQAQAYLRRIREVHDQQRAEAAE